MKNRKIKIVLICALSLALLMGAGAAYFVFAKEIAYPDNFLSMSPITEAYDLSELTPGQIEKAEELWIGVENCREKGFSSTLYCEDQEAAQEVYKGWKLIAAYLEKKQIEEYGEVYLVCSERYYRPGCKYVGLSYRPVTDQEQVDQFVGQAVSEIGLDGTWTELEAAGAICRYVADVYDYDLEWRSAVMGKSLEEGKGVCWHYAQLTQAICKAVGLDCAVVVGHTDPNGNSSHAWNAIKINGEWFWADACWYDSTGEEKYLPHEGQIEKHFLEEWHC